MGSLLILYVMEIVDTIAPPEVKRGIDHTVPREDLPNVRT